MWALMSSRWEALGLRWRGQAAQLLGCVQGRAAAQYSSCSCLTWLLKDSRSWPDAHMPCLAAPQGAPAVGKYFVDVRSFESLALPQLAPAAGTQLYVIDEVGKMELFSQSFYPAVQALLDAAPLVLGTVPVARQGRTLPQVGE